MLRTILAASTGLAAMSVARAATDDPVGGKPGQVQAIAVAGGPAPAAAADPAAQSVSDAAAAAATQADPDAVREVTVTARRRAESLQTTPVSATVLSGADLLQQNIRNFQQLRGAVSNLELVPLATGGTSFTIRGIGQTSAQVNADSKAGFYVNDMYVARQEGNDLYFYDVASLQVLKGPQGTLFGKNTTAGAVLLTTQTPTDRFGGYLQLRGGSYKRFESEGAINLPLSDEVQARVSFRTQNVDGYIHHLLDDGRSGNIDNKSVRGQLHGETGRLTTDLLAEYNQSNTDGGATIPLGCLNTQAYPTNYNALHVVPYCTRYPVLGVPYLVYGGATLNIPTSAGITDRFVGGDVNSPVRRYAGKAPYNDTKVTTVNARLNYALTDKLAIHFTSTYRRSTSGSYQPTMDAPDDIYAENDHTWSTQLTDELTFGGTAIEDRLNFLGGLYYFDQKTRFLQDTGPDWIDPLGYVYDGFLHYRSYAAFAQASFKVTPRLELTVGGRYTYDRKSASSYVFYSPTSATYVVNGVTRTCGAPYNFANIFVGGITNCAGPAYTARGKDHWSGFDPKFQASYRLTDKLFVYATAAHGYNSGGFNQQIGGNTAGGGFPSVYNPERLWSYEGGVKFDLFDKRAQISLAGFYQNYSSIQSTVLVVINGISTRQFTTSATAHEDGVEAEFTLRPTPALNIRGNASYLDQAYDSIVPGALIGLTTPVSSAPRYQYSAAVTYDLHVGDSGILTPGMDVRGVGSKPACYTAGSTTVPSINTCALPAYAIVGFRIDYVPRPDSPWRASLFGTNVLDHLYELTQTGYGGGMGVDRYAPGRPSEFGAEVRYKF